MIPLKLQIKNFLSYGPTTQTIDFEPYHLMCLSGKNGHGKSALLEAITWAVWGQARKTSGTSKADAQLIHLGQTQMMVIFDFAFNDHIYRVRREYAKTYGKPVAALDFGIINPATGTFSSLTTTALRTTQDVIHETLGLDYNAFINTAFLRQGNSNEFSKKSPKERKEILGAILGLQQYDKIRSYAVEKARAMSESVTVSRVSIQKLEQEIEATNTIVQQRNSLDEQQKALQQEELQLTQALNDVRLHEETLLREKMQFEQQCAQLEQLNQRYQQQRAAFITTITTWRSTRNTTINPITLSQLEHTFKESSELITQQHTICKTATELQQKITTLTAEHRETLNQLLQKQTAQIQEFTDTIRAHEAQIALVQQSHTLLTEQHATEQRQLEQAQVAERALIQKIQELHTSLNHSPLAQFEKRKQRYHEWTARAQHITTEYEQVRHKIAMAGSGDNPSCPLCEQHLSASRRSFLTQKCTQQQNFAQHKIKRFRTILPQLKQILMNQHKELEAFTVRQQECLQQETLLQQCQQQALTLQQRLTTLQQELKQRQSELEHTQHLVQTATVHMTQTQTQHEHEQSNHPELKRLTTEIKTLSTMLTDLAHQEPEHQQLMARHEKITKEYQAALSAAHSGIRHHDQARQLHAELMQLQANKKQLRNYPPLQERLKQGNDQHTQLLQQKMALTTQLQSLQRTKEIMLQERGKINHAQQRLERLHSDLQKEHDALKKISTQIDDYTTIALALSKDGVQALLIEDAIPEIEHEANALLAQLTDNQTHLFIDSLRDLKRGGTKETLDIKISDAAGIRPYELFSGGEAFRIDFALRIAVSKLLARRAGTSLQTLIIDEGFGSQDEDGLAHIMDAIHRIQDNFCKVIIVSHLPSMKEQFPVHFMVYKTAQGSSVQVIQQG